MTTSLDEAMASQFSGNFLDASDLPKGKTVVVTISDVVAPNVERDATKKMIDKAILSFSGKQKRLILNKTNAKIIKMSHGEPSNWVGQKITLTVRLLAEAFGQKNVPVIRVVPPPGTNMTFGMRKKYGAEMVTDKVREPGED